jgi:hypothetical protein
MSVKCLRVVLDSQLTWGEHVNTKMKKALLWACRRVCGVTWGLRPKVVYWLYVSIIQPSVTFAPLVWWPSYQKASAKTRLSRIQRLAYLVIKGAVRTTAAGAMEAFTWRHLMQWFRVRQDQLHINSRVWDIGLTFTSVEGTAVYCCGFRSWFPCLMWGSVLWGQDLNLKPSIGLLCWVEKSGPDDLGLLPQLRGSSGIQTGPERRGELGLETMGSLWEEGSASL